MAHCNACIPPKLPPMTAANRWIPSVSASIAWVCTQSFTVTAGKVAPHGFPVVGLMATGPVLPLQPPRLFSETTKNLLVSMGLPGPMQASHQPGFASSGEWKPAA